MTENPPGQSSYGNFLVYEIIGNASLDSPSGVCPLCFYSCGPGQQATGPVVAEKIPTCYVYTARGGSPILLDVANEGFWLTSKEDGVIFQLDSHIPSQQMSWTDPAHHNAWLVIPNADGSVTSVAENMFGNLSPQLDSEDRNGYKALAFLAELSGCGKISRLAFDTCPVVWQQLRLWQDSNHDAIAQPEELHTFESLGVSGISLEFHESKYMDQYGNSFEYAAPVFEATGAEVDHRSYDVFLLQ